MKWKRSVGWAVLGTLPGLVLLVLSVPVGPDLDLLLGVGGITKLKKLAGMAEAFNLPVVSHLIPEIQIHTMSAIPNGLTVEYMPWSLRMWDETPAIEDGEMVVPGKPGLGLTFNQDTIKQYQVS